MDCHVYADCKFSEKIVLMLARKDMEDRVLIPTACALISSCP